MQGIKKALAMLLMIALTLGVFAPMAIAAEGEIHDYASFISELKVLEGYAENYAQTHTANDAIELVINFIRTGVDKYTTGSWTTLAGEEITGFTSYVAQQDASRGTTASRLRNLNVLIAPNGQEVEFEHMFGAMNIAYINRNSADIGSWAGDLCDLIALAKGGVSGDIETMAKQVRDNFFGRDEDEISGFGMQDVYGDLDAFYLMAQIRAGSGISAAMESYYTATLTDNDRAAYFLNNRFKGLLTKEDVRNAIFNTYSNDVAIKILESDYGITAADADLRKACCYCFADYLYELAADRLTGEGAEEEEETPIENFYSVFSSKDSTLAPGIEQTVTYALTREDKQLVYYYLTLDLNNENVLLHANYKDHDPSGGWGMSRVPDQIAAAQKRHGDEKSDLYIENYNVVAGTNGDFYNMTTGKPAGSLVMDGVTYHPNSNRCFFAILNDGTPVIGKGSEWAQYEGNVSEAVGGSEVILRDGKISTASGGTKAPRTAIGITAEGKVVLIVIDGRQDPHSVGTTLEETAQILLDAGCEIGLNLDGGGSSTFASKPEGSDKVVVLNSPSDGYVRSVSSSLVVASTAVISNEFDHALISSDYDYLTPGTSLDMNAIGVSGTGHSAELPADAQWVVSDESVGTVEDGVFTAADFGEVDVQLVADEKVVGSKTLNVVVPDTMNFAKDVVPVIYGVKTAMPLQLSYEGNPVKFNDNDVIILLEDGYDHTGVFEGTSFTADEASGVRTVRMVAILLLNEDVAALATLNMYKDGEAVFDFDTATAGNRTLAWNRVVNNATTEDDRYYQAIDPTEPMSIDYTFALDMEYAEIPPKLKDLTYMLPGGDVEGTTAWEFLLRLAERVSDLTEVRVTATFSKDLDVDISNITFVNDYFEIKSATIDEETNTVTVVVKWIDQTKAIDPATSNPVCILNGVKATVKDGAAWNADSEIDVTNLGSVSYNIYMRANALYTFANDPENASYSLIPYVHPNDPGEKGASFSAQYVDFEDSITLNNALRQGWIETNGELSYYVDNVALTGNHKLPGYEDAQNEYLYGFDENGICTGTLTGLVDLDGELYYAVQGEVKTGWRTVDGEYYYFDLTTGAAVDGVQKIGGRTYTFTNYILTKGEIVKVDGGYRYYWAGGHVIGKWIEHEGNTYYATYPKGYFAIGMVYARNREETASHRYLFSETGVLQNHVNGLYDYEGNTYYVVDGQVIDEPGLVYHEGYYYYFSSTGAAVKNRNYWITKTNGLLPPGAYYFDAEGKMTNPPTTEPGQPDQPDQPEQPEVRNGIVEVNGILYYYVNGNLKYGAGLIKLDGYYYYVRSNAQLAIGRYWVTTHNDLLPQGMYTFDTDGKMIDPPDAPKPTEPTTEKPSEEPTEPTETTTEKPSEEPTEPGTQKPTEPAPVKEGIYEEGGALYYYENGTRAYCKGLIKLDGYYYYVRSNAQLATGKYWITTTNGLLPQGMYNFGTDGKMINPPDEPKPTEPTTEKPSEEPTETTTEEPTTEEPTTEEPTTEEPTTEEPTEPEKPTVKEGIYRENGVLYFYENGTRAYCKGLIFYEGYYYYVRSNAQLAIGKYWVTTHNDLLPSGMYNFDEEGRMIR